MVGGWIVKPLHGYLIDVSSMIESDKEDHSLMKSMMIEGLNVSANI